MKIDGKAIAQHILDDLKGRVATLKKKGATPHLVIILIGDDPASKAYVNQKELKVNVIGAKVTINQLPSTITQAKLLATIQQYNNDNNIQGIIVQQPLPPHIEGPTITSAIDPKKDVDGFHPQTKYEMPLAQAVIRILEEFASDFKQKGIVIIGKGETGGGPIMRKLRTLNIEPKIIDSKTINPELITKNADIIISAVGKPSIVTPDAIKKGVVLISVGLHKGKDGKLHGDYNEEEIKDIAAYYTPTPGGVGPVNVAMLLENLVRAAENESISRG